MLLALVLAGLGWSERPASAETARVAVAANFLGTLEKLAPGFTAATGHAIEASGGSTGKLYAQIREGAPFDVFLSADADKPARLVEEGFADPASRITYAIGRVVLWSNTEAATGADCWAVLADGSGKVAIANPDTAPYGTAAMEILRAKGLAEATAPRLVQGKDIAQAFQFIETENAEIGFVALSQVDAMDGARGCRAEVEPELYLPLVQDAVMLSAAASPEAARALLDYLGSDEARAIIAGDGYGVP